MLQPETILALFHQIGFEWIGLCYKYTILVHTIIYELLCPTHWKFYWNHCFTLLIFEKERSYHHLCHGPWVYIAWQWHDNKRKSSKPLLCRIFEEIESDYVWTQKTPTIEIFPNLYSTSYVRVFRIMVQRDGLPIQIHLQNASILHNHGVEAVLSREGLKFPYERVSKRELPQSCYSLIFIFKTIRKKTMIPKLNLVGRQKSWLNKS